MSLDSVYKHLLEVFPMVDVPAGAAIPTAVQTSESLPCENGGIVGTGDKQSDYQNSIGESADISKVEVDLSAMNMTFVNENASNNKSDQVHVDFASGIFSSSQTFQESSKEDMEVLDDSSLVGDVAPSSIQKVLLDGPANSIQLVMVPVTPITHEEPEPSDSFITVSKNDVPSSEMVDCENELTMHTMADPETPFADVDKLEQSNFAVAASEEGLAATVFDNFEDETNMNTTIRSQYGHIYNTQHLEDIIESSRSEKITLHSAKESLFSLMKEVELKENNVEQAKEEAARGGLSILTTVKELKQMLQRAKEANDMNAGEVYGEKAILATEVRELQSRLLSLSDERNKALAMLDEMRQSLEVRLEDAEREIKAAEQERIDKEEFAHKSLAYENSIMEKVVQESKILEQEAEKNSELREFLMDRGRLVDIIQGEISVVCQDIKLIKEKFDQRVPLSKLLSSSYTSSSLTSSSSSITSTAPQQVSELIHSRDRTEARRETSIADDQLSSKEEVRSHHKERIDDGWEFFDKQECSM